MKHIITILLCLSALLWAGCEGFFGKKTDTEFLDPPLYNDRTVAYVPVIPALSGFDMPTDVIVGWDELIYVVDEGKEMIISYDQAGKKLSSFSVPGAYKIAQLRNLDLLVTGTKDTLVGGQNLTLPALYRIRQTQGNASSLAFARIQNTLVHPFCFNPSSTANATDEQVVFTGVGILADGRYYLSKTGPGTAGSTLGDAVVLFDAKDNFQTPINVSTTVGLYTDYFKLPQSICTYVQPPQSPAVSTKGDFIFASWSSSNVLKVQGILYKESDNGASYETKIFTDTDTAKGRMGLSQPYRFAQPSDIAIAGDGTGYIFVTDAEKDSLFIFNSLGYEGVTPPAGASSKKAVFASFGGKGTASLQFQTPVAVAYEPTTRVVYVVDQGNRRVSRFKLTTDFR